MLSTERRVATIFHHHDFWWERSRFSNNNIDFRRKFGFSEKDFLIVQPTGNACHKRLEDSLELVSLLARKYTDMKNRVHLIVSLYQGDEPDRSYPFCEKKGNSYQEFRKGK